MSPELEWRMWKQLRGAFGINSFIMTPVVHEFKTTARMQQFDTMEEVLENCKGQRVFLEQKGDLKLSSVKWNNLLNDGDICIILGNTQMGNSHLVTKSDFNVRIDYESNTDLYGINAAAIALAYMVGQ